MGRLMGEIRKFLSYLEEWQSGNIDLRVCRCWASVPPPRTQDGVFCVLGAQSEVAGLVLRCPALLSFQLLRPYHRPNLLFLARDQLLILVLTSSYQKTRLHLSPHLLKAVATSVSLIGWLPGGSLSQNAGLLTKTKQRQKEKLHRFAS